MYQAMVGGDEGGLLSQRLGVQKKNIPVILWGYCGKCSEGGDWYGILTKVGYSKRLTTVGKD